RACLRLNAGLAADCRRAGNRLSAGRALATRARFQMKQALEPIHEPLIGVRLVEHLQDVEAFLDGTDSPNAKLAGAPGNLVSVAPPHENRTGGRVNGDVEAVLWPVVDKHVQAQRRGDLAS